MSKLDTFIQHAVNAVPVSGTSLISSLYATAHGVYEVTLNGQTVGDYRMAPGWTSYHNRLQYQIYDVTEQLAEENEIAITVGNGWYKGILGFYCQPNQYGTQAGAFAELHVEYEDGSKEVIATDETWAVNRRDSLQ